MLPRFHRLKQGLLRLEGTVCSTCGLKHLPARRICSSCRGRDMAVQPFRGRGTLVSATVAYAAPPSFCHLPCVFGWVELDEGVSLLAQLVEVPAGEARAGLRVEMVTRKLTETASGLIVYGYKFRPEEPSVEGSTT